MLNEDGSEATDSDVLMMVAGEGCLECRGLCKSAFPYLRFDEQVVTRSDEDRLTMVEILIESSDNRAQKAKTVNLSQACDKLTASPSSFVWL